MYRIFFTCLALAASVSAGADTVDSNEVTVFQPGTTLESAAVNDTLAALIAAINNNAARIAALESASSQDVAGRSYALRQVGVLFRGNNNGSMTVGNLSQSYTVSFDESNGYSFTGTESEGEVTANGTVIAQDIDAPVAFSGTYSQDGHLVTLNIEGESISFVVGLDGSVLLLSQFTLAPEDDSTFSRTESSFVVGAEIQGDSTP